MQISDIFFLTGFIVAASVFVMLVWLYGRVTGAKTATRDVTTANASEMAILFQTMRAVVHEQKTLTRDFNDNVDKKITLIRQVIDKVVEEHKTLHDSRRETAKRLENMERELEATRAELRALRANTNQDSSTVQNSERPTEPTDSAQTTEPKRDPAPLRIIVEPEDDEPPSGWDDLWVGFDFVGADADNEEEPETPPETSEAPEAIRGAFRALLDISEEEPNNERSGEQVVSAKIISKTAVNGANGNSNGNANGAGRSAALRGRVYDYHDAGMSIAEIAQELGVGKGEVRLMLSLRDKGRR
jgi:hypothetical protein